MKQSCPLLGKEGITWKDASHEGLQPGNLVLTALLKDRIALSLMLVLPYLLTFRQIMSHTLMECLTQVTLRISSTRVTNLVATVWLQYVCSRFRSQIRNLTGSEFAAKLIPINDKSNHHTKRLSCSISAAC